MSARKSEEEIWCRDSASNAIKENKFGVGTIILWDLVECEVGCIHGRDYFLKPGVISGIKCKEHGTTFMIPTSHVVDFKLNPKAAEPTKIVKVTLEHLEKLTLAEEVKREILSVVKQYENKDLLMNEWGLKDVIEYGIGMVFLFYGPPGTGKTYTAKLLADALGKKLTCISNAELQSQIPGEFERNVKAAFEKAKRDQEVVLFDECDGMIQSRQGMGQIMSSENNMMLQEIEKHDGIIFMTTNRVDSLDEALERRVSLIIEFKMPTQAEREQIWTKLIPKKLPLAKNVDFKKLSEYNLSGGHIKNVVLNAARYAAGDDEKKVSMEHFEKALKRVQKGSKAFAAPRQNGWNQRDKEVRRG